MKFRKIAFTVLLLGIGATIATARTFEKVYEHAFPADQFDRTEIEIDQGDVSVSSTESQTVSVVIKMTIEARNQDKADDAMDAYKIRFTEDDGVAKAILKKERSGWSRWFFWRAEPEVQVGVQVPDGARVKIATGSGDVQLADIETDIDIATGAGDIQARNLNGSVNIATGAGDVGLDNFTGKVSVATGAGDLEANGNISSFSIATGKGDVELELTNSEFEKASIATGMGDVELALPGNTAFDIGAEVGFGEITCEFQVDARVQEKKELKGTVNGGGTKVGLATGFGDIGIKAGRISE